MSSRSNRQLRRALTPLLPCESYRYEGHHEDKEFLEDAEGRFGGDLTAYALHRLAYYPCHECDKPYFGGDARCGVGGVDFRPEDLICGACVPAAPGSKPNFCSSQTLSCTPTHEETLQVAVLLCAQPALFYSVYLKVINTSCCSSALATKATRVLDAFEANAM